MSQWFILGAHLLSCDL